MSDLEDFLTENLKFSYKDNVFLINDKEIPQEELRTPQINKVIAFYGRIPEVKNHVVHSQRNFVRDNSDMWWILDGRCMGTGVAPKAIAKIYVEADLEAKAGWRFQDYNRAGKESSFISVKEELAKRDEMDKKATPFPLFQPSDSLYILSHLASPDVNARKIYEYFEDRVRRYGKKKEQS